MGLYEVRTFHVTDVRRRFDFGTYLSTRLLTCLVMVCLILIHSWNSSTKDPYPAFTVIAAMALLRIFDAFEDVYYSEFQRSGRLDIAGKACFARIFTTTFLWSGLYWVTQDLLIATLVTYVIGAPLLTLVFGTDVSDYVPELMVLVLGGALNAAGVILYYALATMRRLRAVLVAFLIAGGTAYLAAAPLVRSFAMMGASLAYAATMALLAILFVVFMLIPTHRPTIETEPVSD